MFEVGFSEMLLIGVVALVVLGPERLPRAARMVGLWVRRMRAYWFSMQAQLEQELAAEELRKAMRETQDSLAEMKAKLDTPVTAAVAPSAPPAPDAGRAEAPSPTPLDPGPHDGH